MSTAHLRLVDDPPSDPPPRRKPEPLTLPCWFVGGQTTPRTKAARYWCRRLAGKGKRAARSALRKKVNKAPQLQLESLSGELESGKSSCRSIPGPCPLVSCRYNLFLDVNPQTGRIKFNFPGKQVWELRETCAIRVSATEQTTEAIAALFGVTPERISQITTVALEKLRHHLPILEGLDLGSAEDGGNLDP